MTLLEQIQKVAEEKGYDSRKYRYRILSELTGTPEDICEKIVSLDRNMRWAFPADEVGLSKALEYQTTPEFKNEEGRLFKLSPIIN